MKDGILVINKSDLEFNKLEDLLNKELKLKRFFKTRQDAFPEERFNVIDHLGFDVSKVVFTFDEEYNTIVLTPYKKHADVTMSAFVAEIKQTVKGVNCTSQIDFMTTMHEPRFYMGCYGFVFIEFENDDRVKMQYELFSHLEKIEVYYITGDD